MSLPVNPLSPQCSSGGVEGKRPIGEAQQSGERPEEEQPHREESLTAKKVDAVVLIFLIQEDGHD